MAHKSKEFLKTKVYYGEYTLRHWLDLMLSRNFTEDARFIYHNYYFRFSILILLDEIFIRLFRTYQETMGKVI